MKQPFLEEDNFFKSTGLNEDGTLVKAKKRNSDKELTEEDLKNAREKMKKEKKGDKEEKEYEEEREKSCGAAAPALKKKIKKR